MASPVTTGLFACLPFFFITFLLGWYTRMYRVGTPYSVRGVESANCSRCGSVPQGLGRGEPGRIGYVDHLVDSVGCVHSWVDIVATLLDRSDGVKLAENFAFGEAPPIPAADRHIQLSDTAAQFGNRKLASCKSFQVVPVALVYNSELCRAFGSRQATERRLMTIAASASAMYERDMCVQLQLTDIHTPDRNCSGESPTFGEFFFSNACGGTESLLDDFTAWARKERGSIGVNTDSLLHLFTGVPRPTNSRTIGCAWIGVVSSAQDTRLLDFLTRSSVAVLGKLVVWCRVLDLQLQHCFPDARLCS